MKICVSATLVGVRFGESRSLYFLRNALYNNLDLRKFNKKIFNQIKLCNFYYSTDNGP